MKKAMTLIAVLGGALLLTACADKAVPSNELAGHRFVLVSANDSVLTESIPPVIEFATTDDSNKLQVVGKMCNNFTGVASYKNGVLKADGLAMTRAMCVAPALNALDFDISNMLSEGAKVEKTGELLTLRTEKTTLVYQQQDIK